MSTENKQYLTAELIEKENFEIEISEKEIITIKLKSIDVIYKNVDSSVYDDIFDKHVYNEVPTKLTSTTFQTAYAYRTGKIRVFLNGVKIHDSEITEESSITFSFDNYNVDNDDLVEVCYIKS